jgi:hypothetical protein
MLRAFMIAGALAVLAPFSPNVSAQGKASAANFAALEKLFARAYLYTDPEGKQWVLQYAWVVQGREYETRFIGPEERVTRYTIFPDGSLSGRSGSETVLGYLSSAGLPIVKSTFKGKDIETRLESNGDGYVSITLQNQANAGEPPVWQEIARGQRRPISMAEASQLAEKLKQERQAQRPTQSGASSPPAGNEYRAQWGDLAGLVGGVWTDGPHVTWYSWEKPGKKLVTYNFNSDGAFVNEYVTTGADGKAAWSWNAGLSYKNSILPDGSFFTGTRLWRRTGPGTFTVTMGKLKKGVFTPSSPLTSGTYRLMTTAQVAEFNRLKASAEAQRLANSSSGNSGLMGALAMATGAALAGGNAEQVMGMAMKGAELTTDNEMSRNVLAGQGDAMVAAGTQRMAAENQSVAGSSGSVGAAGADTRAGVPMPAGSPATAPAAKSATVSTTAYLIVGMRPTEKNTRNPMCYSTPFQISYQSEENHWGDSGRAETAAMAYRGQFEAACSRHGEVYGVTSPHLQSIHGGSPSADATSQDFVVRIP